MTPLLVALLVLLGSTPLILALIRANELFFLRVRRGQVKLVRGKIPPALLADIGDVVRDPPVEAATLRGVVEDRAARLYAEGDLGDAQRQRLRNVIGQWPVTRIRNAPGR
jgi:hypothetical protein